MFPKPIVFRLRYAVTCADGTTDPLSWVCVTATALTNGGVSFHDSWLDALDRAQRWWSSFD